MERTLVILKPDAVQRRLCGALLERFEHKGFKIVGLKMSVVERALLEKHYAAHAGKPFYKGLLRFMLSGPVVFAVLEGHRAVEVVRGMMGKTFAFEAAPGTIRGDYGISNQFNLIHGSDSTAAAEKEIALFFSPAELVEYSMDDDRWMASD